MAMVAMAMAAMARYIIGILSFVYLFFKFSWLAINFFVPFVRPSYGYSNIGYGGYGLGYGLGYGGYNRIGYGRSLYGGYSTPYIGRSYLGGYGLGGYRLGGYGLGGYGLGY